MQEYLTNMKKKDILKDDLSAKGSLYSRPFLVVLISGLTQ